MNELTFIEEWIWNKNCNTMRSVTRHWKKRAVISIKQEKKIFVVENNENDSNSVAEFNSETLTTYLYGETKNLNWPLKVKLNHIPQSSTRPTSQLTSVGLPKAKSSRYAARGASTSKGGKVSF